MKLSAGVSARVPNSAYPAGQTLGQGRTGLGSFCRETAVQRGGNRSRPRGGTPVAARIVSLPQRGLLSKPRPLGTGLTCEDRVSRQKLAKVCSTFLLFGWLAVSTAGAAVPRYAFSVPAGGRAHRLGGPGGCAVR